MILVDANILLYAEDKSSVHHEAMRDWWDDQLSSDKPVCLCWPVILAYVRIATNHRVFKKPLPMMAAIARVDSWFQQPCVRVIAPTSRHWEVLKVMLAKNQANANLAMDAHLAALSVEHGCTLFSTDMDFARFKGIRWQNPAG